MWGYRLKRNFGKTTAGYQGGRHGEQGWGA